jgi:hypothetical protein
MEPARKLVLNHVRQQTHCDCVIATAALVANCPYGSAAEISPIPPGERAFRPREIQLLLTSVTGVKWRGPKRNWLGTLESFAKCDQIVVLLIRRKQPLLSITLTAGVAHCIALTGGMVYDPECEGPVHFKEYSRANWSILAFYSTRNMNGLRSVQEANQKAHREERIWNLILNR